MQVERGTAWVLDKVGLQVAEQGLLLAGHLGLGSEQEGRVSAEAQPDGLNRTTFA